MGDFNAATSNENDYVLCDKADSRFIPVPNDTFYDIPLARSNMDSRKVDEHGKMLLDLCISTGLRTAY